ncbi:MAG: UDP-3-O-(3-hydroxymyristoyl)glucosamine N-acyltransferase [Endomicrobium sp.]|jgi:UDP-3-O-[3-hydroxymyristoyl] glucosamine N-acyltransferase|uniref:UDP-3-O-(3-hydroxymyristoyl)glucosamine N-acyltransferase n=1 Tax=Candidatus Endomicrobiellum cubanum TaxID=3242325 RepID=UPI0028375D0C|nr:UDP-3-O-(3-hydroxymyristoyl)glucosamine N-acyltransferase [Endomicrobium sp.]
MKLTACELANIVAGQLIGKKDILLTGVNSLSNAKENEISFLGNLKYLQDALTTKAGVIFVAFDTDISKFKDKNIIKVENPQYSYSIVLSLIEKERLNEIIHSTACISNDSVIGISAYIGQNVVVESGTKIGNNAKIFPNVYIGKNVTIGDDCLIYPNVVIREGTIIGNRVIIQPGAVIGGDGFGFANISGKIYKIPQIGYVKIGDDVEIGANTTIDRATFDSTKIGNGTKIDNLVQIAHNVEIGEDCIIVAQVGIAGSTHIGNNVTIAGQTGLGGHLKIGNNVTIASQSGISGNVKDGQQVGGNPMAPLNQSIKIRALIRKLPEIYNDLKKIKKDLEDK